MSASLIDYIYTIEPIYVELNGHPISGFCLTFLYKYLDLPMIYNSRI
jgi:hypothetical protein